MSETLHSGVDADTPSNPEVTPSTVETPANLEADTVDSVQRLCLPFPTACRELESDGEIVDLDERHRAVVRAHALGPSVRTSIRHAASWVRGASVTGSRGGYSVRQAARTQVHRGENGQPATSR